MGMSKALPFTSLFKKRNPNPFFSCNQPKNHCYSYLDSTECYVEAAMQAMSTKRLFLDAMRKELVVGVPFEGSIAVEVESKDLYRDFLDSMKEMVEVKFNNGEVKDLVWMGEMLGWYLRMNKRWTHEFIIEAYWDLILELLGTSSTSSGGSISHSPCSSNCLASSSYFTCLSEIEEVEEGNGSNPLETVL